MPDLPGPLPSLLRGRAVQPIGHRLQVARDGDQLVARCECGRWRRALPGANEEPLLLLVARLTGKHEQHLGRVGRLPAEDNASTDTLPRFPDGGPPSVR